MGERRDLGTEIAKAEVLRWEHACFVYETSVTPGWLEQPLAFTPTKLGIIGKF